MLKEVTETTAMNIRQADANLYRAKRAGKNRTCAEAAPHLAPRLEG